MKIYDCFLFSSELELALLRMEFLSPFVDYFVVVESARTLSNKPKPLTFSDNRSLFGKFNDKIIHVVAESNDLPAWEYEYFQRNSIKEGLKNCLPDDLIFISDVDEIVNIPEILKTKSVLTSPSTIELPMYYYYFNLRTDDSYQVNLVAPYSAIRDVPLGDRRNYLDQFPNRITNRQNKNGWHFSYLFGRKIELYVSKVKSFSHQEFNTPYFLDEGRIGACVDFGIDLFERALTLTVDDSPMEFLGDFIRRGGLDHYVYYRQTVASVSFKSIYWLVRIRIFNRVKNAIRNRL